MNPVPGRPRKISSPKPTAAGDQRPAPDAPRYRNPPGTFPDDQALAQRALVDRGVFDEIVGRHQTYFLNIATRRMRNRQHAQDLVQEFWLEVFRRKILAGFDGRSTLRTFLTRTLLWRISSWITAGKGSRIVGPPLGSEDGGADDEADAKGESPVPAVGDDETDQRPSGKGTVEDPAVLPTVEPEDKEHPVRPPRGPVPPGPPTPLEVLLEEEALAEKRRRMARAFGLFEQALRELEEADFEAGQLLRAWAARVPYKQIAREMLRAENPGIEQPDPETLRRKVNTLKQDVSRDHPTGGLFRLKIILRRLMEAEGVTHGDLGYLEPEGGPKGSDASRAGGQGTGKKGAGGR